VAWWQGVCWHGSLPGLLGKWGGEREKQNAGKAALSSPVLCVSRERRKVMVSFKTTPFAYSFFFLNSARNDVVLPKNTPFHLKGNDAKMCQIQNQAFNLRAFFILVLGLRFLQLSP
jgi:hypothetical protein